MVKPLSLDLRERIVAAVASGMSPRQAVERFGVSPASASDIALSTPSRKMRAPVIGPQRLVRLEC